jgi:Ca2+-binding RTX toxin-like protein
MRVRHAILAAIAAALAAPSGAVAATTFGSDLGAAAGPGPDCPGGAARCTVVRTGPAGTVAAPSAGVIVAWRVKAAAAGAFRLRVLRSGSGSGSSYTAISSSAEETVAAGTNVFATRLPVEAGDQIGIDGAGTPAAFGGSGATDLVGYDPPGQTFADGETRAADAAGGADLLVNADIEPDADGDGYGDESQDACPSDAARRTACDTDLALGATGPEYGVVGQGSVHEYSVRTARDGATGVVVTITVPSGAAVLAASASTGTCTTEGATVRCAVGTLFAGRTATVAVTVTRSAPGALATTGRVSTEGSDPNMGNDAASWSTQFTPPSLAPPSVALPNPACANTIRGTRDDDVLVGTVFGDRMIGAQGSDLLRAGGGDDCLEGGSNSDVLDGAVGNDRLLGGLGRDRLLGGPGNDVLTAGHGPDYLTGSMGDDVLNPGKGRDRAVGGAGNDTINARDRTRDSIDCGPGADAVRADRFDRVRGCERRLR